VSVLLRPTAPPDRRVVLGLLAAVACAALYWTSFRDAQLVRTRLNAVAHADSNHYLELLRDGHFLSCLSLGEAGVHAEHRRKTVHHVGYLAVASPIVGVGRRAGLAPDEAVWLVSPIIGALNVLLSVFVFVRARSGAARGWAAVVALALTPATWIYAAIPETWLLSGTAVLVVQLLRLRGAPAWQIGLAIGVAMLANLLLGLLALLAIAVEDSLRVGVRKVVVAGSVAAATWLGALCVLALVVSPLFWPTQFFGVTASFKEALPANLSPLHPARWIYCAVNLLWLPLVTNQPSLQFGRAAVVDSLRHLPLGTAAAALLAMLGVSAIATFARGLFRARPVLLDRDASLLGDAVYLAGVLLASGAAAYYESFLYSPMATAVLISLLTRGTRPGRLGTAMLWTAAIVWSLNAAQQVLMFRAQLGAP
jgi:hypothetical protein